MKKVFYILVPVIAFLLFAAQVDNDLSEEATSLIDRIDTKGSSESYLYILLSTSCRLQILN